MCSSDLTLITISIFGILGLYKIKQNLETTIEDRLVPTHLLAQINTMTEDCLANLVLSNYHNPKYKENEDHIKDHSIYVHIERIQKNIENSEVLWNEFLKSNMNEEEKNLVNEYSKHRRILIHNYFIKSIEIMQKEHYEELGPYVIGTILPEFKKTKEEFYKLADIQIKVGKEEGEKSKNLFIYISIFLIIILLVSILVVGLLSKKIIFSIVDPLKNLMNSILEISSGNLHANKVEYKSENEIGILYKSFIKMVESIKGLMNDTEMLVQAALDGRITVTND